MYCRIINANIQNCRITNSTRRDAFTDYSHGNGITSNFTYNYNGSLTFDPAKQANYAYNILGMPKTVTVPNINGTITYKYSATGQKLSVDYKWHNGLSLDPLENIGKNFVGTNSSKTVEYIGNKIYENGSLKQILLPNGYYSNGYYYFYLRDHLGNNCVVAHSSGGIAQSTYYHPYGKPIGNGESWGQSTQPYLFGNKERDDMFGLGQYDFSARTLDDYGRFLTIDPLAEKYYSISPYAYCLNNPIRWTDKDGRNPGDPFETKIDAVNDFAHYYNGTSIVRNKEFGSAIYKNSNGTYSYTIAFIGVESETYTNEYIPRNTTREGAIHTHGGDDALYGSKSYSFSTEDKRVAESIGQNEYIVTPAGQILEYNVSTGESSVPEGASNNIPSDDKSGSRRVNTVDATDTNPTYIDPETNETYNQ